MENAIFKAIKDELYEYIVWDEKKEEYIIRGKKIPPHKALALMMDLLEAIQDNFISSKEFEAHYHTEIPSLERRVRTN